MLGCFGCLERSHNTLLEMVIIFTPASQAGLPAPTQASKEAH